MMVTDEYVGARAECEAAVPAVSLAGLKAPRQWQGDRVQFHHVAEHESSRRTVARPCKGALPHPKSRASMGSSSACSLSRRGFLAESARLRGSAHQARHQLESVVQCQTSIWASTLGRFDSAFVALRLTQITAKLFGEP